MVVTNINQIVNNMILKRGYSKHYYLEFLLYARECLREIGMDDIIIINSKIIPVNSNDNTFEIPNDYLDYVTVGIRVGQLLRPLVEADGADTLQNYNDDWETVKFSSGDIEITNNQTGNNQSFAGAFGFGQWFTTHFNSFGEQTGRFYGGVAYSDTFKVLKAANKIKLNEALTVNNAVLVYVSNGDSADAVSAIDPYCENTIRKYIMYQFKSNNRTYSENEAQVAYNDYVSERRVLRARVSDLSLSKLRRIVNRTTIASPKN